MALVGNMIQDAFAGNPSIVNYCMFVAVFSMLSLFYLFAATANEGFALHPLLMLAVDLLNTLFFLIAGIALAAELRVHSCGNEVCLLQVHSRSLSTATNGFIKDYTHSNFVTNGSHNPGKRCHEAQAVCAFLWFGFAAYAGSLVFSGLASRGGGANLRSGGIRRGGPAMSQV